MKPLFTLLIVLSVLLINSKPAEAATRLRSIMNELDMNIIRVVDGVMREDFDLIEYAAHAIAEHEKAPVSERKQIAAYLKSRAADFTSVDLVLHNNAKAIAVAAARHDMKVVVKNMLNVQKGCVECHTSFRAEVKQLFYK